MVICYENKWEKEGVQGKGRVAVDVWCPQRGSGYVRFVVVIIVYM